jgi:tRNA/rRNA methyltransferase
MPFYVYMLECGDGSFYTGQTDDLELRLIQHDEGEVPGYVKKHMRFELVWYQEFPTRDEALNREQQIKGWTRRKKIALIEQDWEKLKRFSIGRERSGRRPDPSTPEPLHGSSAQGERE